MTPGAVAAASRLMTLRLADKNEEATRKMKLAEREIQSFQM